MVAISCGTVSLGAISLGIVKPLRSSKSRDSSPAHFVPPFALPIFNERVTYSAQLAMFMLALDHVIRQLPTVGGFRWNIDGHTSDRLFLRLPSDLSVAGISHLDEVFTLSVTASTVTLGVFTRSNSTFALYQQLTLSLDRIIIRINR